MGTSFSKSNEPFNDSEQTKIVPITNIPKQILILFPKEKILKLKSIDKLYNITNDDFSIKQACIYYDKSDIFSLIGRYYTKFDSKIHILHITYFKSEITIILDGIFINKYDSFELTDYKKMNDNIYIQIMYNLLISDFGKEINLKNNIYIFTCGNPHGS